MDKETIKAVLDALEKERKILLEMKMYGAEDVLVHHAIRVIEELANVPVKGASMADEQQTIREKLDRHYERLCEMDKACATLQREIMSAQVEIAVLMRDLQKLERPV